MNLILCDRCHIQLDHDGNQGLCSPNEVILDPENPKDKWDLCDECFEAVVHCVSKFRSKNHLGESNGTPE